MTAPMQPESDTESGSPATAGPTYATSSLQARVASSDTATATRTTHSVISDEPSSDTRGFLSEWDPRLC